MPVTSKFIPLSEKELGILDDSRALGSGIGLLRLHFKKIGKGIYGISRNRSLTAVCWELIDPRIDCSVRQSALSDLKDASDGVWLFNKHKGWYSSIY